MENDAGHDEAECRVDQLLSRQEDGLDPCCDGKNHHASANNIVTEIIILNNNKADIFILPGHRHDFLVTFAGVAGNVLEWYDFAVFGFFGDVIGDVFFPPQAGHSQMVESFAVFGVAFIMRPLGGLLMGYIGDKYGRKKALVLSIFFMAFPTFAMGCLPSYERVGSIAIGLLLITRMLQGMSVGGQLMSSLVFTLEGRDPSVWGLYGSFVMASANFGTLLGNLAAFVIRGSLNNEQLASWGWRIPFLSGILVSVSGFYLKSAHGKEPMDQGPRQATSLSQMAPTDELEIPNDDLGVPQKEELFHDNDSNNGTKDSVQAMDDNCVEPPINPLKLAFARDNLRALAAASMVPMLSSAGFYLVFVWMATYMDELSANPIKASFEVNAFSLLLALCIFYPVAGYISDKLGRIRTMTFGAVTMCLFSPILIRIIGIGNAFAAFGAQLVMGICLSFWGAPMCAWLL